MSTPYIEGWIWGLDCLGNLKSCHNVGSPLCGAFECLRNFLNWNMQEVGAISFVVDLLGLPFSRVTGTNCAFITISRHGLIGGCNHVRIVYKIIQVACLIEDPLHVMHINLFLIVGVIFIG